MAEKVAVVPEEVTEVYTNGKEGTCLNGYQNGNAHDNGVFHQNGTDMSQTDELVALVPQGPVLETEDPKNPYSALQGGDHDVLDPVYGRWEKSGAFDTHTIENSV